MNSRQLQKPTTWLLLALVSNVLGVGGFNCVCFNAFIDQEGYICSYGSLNVFKLEEEKWHKL